MEHHVVNGLPPLQSKIMLLCVATDSVIAKRPRELAVLTQRNFVADYYREIVKFYS